MASISTAVTTKKATSRPKTTTFVAFCAGTTVLSRTVATTFSIVSTASEVQSATAPPSVAGRLTRMTERTRTGLRSAGVGEVAELARIREHRVERTFASGRLGEHHGRGTAVERAVALSDDGAVVEQHTALRERRAGAAAFARVGVARGLRWGGRRRTARGVERPTECGEVLRL